MLMPPDDSAESTGGRLNWPLPRQPKGDKRILGHRWAVQASLESVTAFYQSGCGSRVFPLPIIREAQKAGARTLREIAEALNARGIATPRGGQWYAQSVANILERA
jgi:Recombinase